MGEGVIHAEIMQMSVVARGLTDCFSLCPCCGCCCLQIINHDSSGFGLSHLLLPMLSVCVSLSAGLLGGALISLALTHQLHNRLAALLTAAQLVGTGHSSSMVAYR